MKTRVKKGRLQENRSMMKSQTSPLAIQRSSFIYPLDNHYDFPAGKMAPIAMFDMFREDAIKNCRFRVAMQMAPTEKMLFNTVRLAVRAYLVPWLADPRFTGIDDFNTSYSRVPLQEGTSVKPFYNMISMPSSSPIYDTLGLPYADGDSVNDQVLSAYNQIWNYRAKNRSKDITLRDLDDHTLAPAFNNIEAFEHIVSDWDEAAQEGNVPLAVADGRLPISGLGWHSGSFATDDPATVTETSGDQVTYDWQRTVSSPAITLKARGSDAVTPDFYAELQNGGLTLSLADINSAQIVATLARQKESFSAYTGDEEHLADLLMSGIRIQDLHLRDPILLSEQIVPFQMTELPATDGASLGESATNGIAAIDMSIRTPAINTGGTVIIVAECVPDPTHERVKNQFMYMSDTANLPDYVRDIADPQKVEIITNGDMDPNHSNPGDPFGYAPKHSKFIPKGSRVGGSMKKEPGSSWTEDRAHIWDLEVVDLTLNEHFYLATGIHQDVFMDTDENPFRGFVTGAVQQETNTQFGPRLYEANEHYDEIMDTVDQTRIDTST